MNSIIDRKKAPKIFAVTDIPLPVPEIFHLDNGIPVYVINMGNIDAVRIEVIFKAGRPQEHKPTVGRATAALIKEGTIHKTSAEIAEHFDFFGGRKPGPALMGMPSGKTRSPKRSRNWPRMASKSASSLSRALTAITRGMP